MKTPISDERIRLSGWPRIVLIAFQCSMRIDPASVSINALCASARLSTSLRSWLKANRPISTGRIEKPWFRSSMPKEKREVAVIASSPIIARNSPMTPAMPPLSRESPERLAMMVSAKTISEKYSHGPNHKPISASGGANDMSSTAPTRPPKNDDQTPTPRARPGWPRRAMGKPSKVVATEEGVPGMPNKVPEMRPPEKPPTKTPSMVESPSMGLMPKVKGSVSTIAMVMVKPGIAPATMPASVPTVMSAISLT